MKNRIIGFFFLAFIITVCTPPVVFDQAYPIGEKDLEELPSAFTGAFICESDSSLLLIKKHEVVVRKENYFTLPLKYVEEREDCNVVGQEMYVSGRAECIPLEFINDSTVRGLVIEHDTLFAMSKNAVARMYQGHVVLSQKIEDNQWAVSFLTLQKNTDIQYSAITDETEISNIGSVTKLEDITTKEDKNNRYKIKPTMKQFDELISDDKVFIECEYLTRVFLETIPSRPIVIKRLD